MYVRFFSYTKRGVTCNFRVSNRMKHAIPITISPLPLIHVYFTLLLRFFIHLLFVEFVHSNFQHIALHFDSRRVYISTICIFCATLSVSSSLFPHLPRSLSPSISLSVHETVIEAEEARRSTMEYDNLHRCFAHT